MAVDTNFYSSKELAVGVGLDASNIGTAFAGTFTSIEVDSVSFPSFNDLRIERRSGAASGIMTASSDLFYYDKGSVIELSISGYLTDDLFQVLTANAIGTAYSSNVISIANAVTTNASFQHGATSATDKTLTFAFNGVGGSGFDDCVAIPGCVITSLNINGDPNEDGGRMKFDLTAQSRTPIAKGSTFTATAYTMSAFDTDYTFLGDFKNHCKIHNVDALLKSFSMSIENPVQFGGFGGSGSSADGAPQTYIRCIPELSVMINPVVKYDTNFDTLWELSRESTSLTSPAFSMSDHATYNDASATRTIYAADATVEELSWDEGDYLGLNINMKVRGDADPSLYVKYV